MAHNLSSSCSLSGIRTQAGARLLRHQFVNPIAPSTVPKRGNVAGRGVGVRSGPVTFKVVEPLNERSIRSPTNKSGHCTGKDTTSIPQPQSCSAAHLHNRRPKRPRNRLEPEEDVDDDARALLQLRCGSTKPEDSPETLHNQCCRPRARIQTPTASLTASTSRRTMGP